MLGAVLRRCGLLWAGLGAVGARQYPDCPAGGPALRAAQPQPLRVFSYNFYLCVQLPPAYFGVGSPFHSLALRRAAINRDRGASHDATPPTPPGIRVRTTAVRRIKHPWVPGFR